MPDATINHTPSGVPYLDDDNYLAVWPAYTEELADLFDAVGSPTAAMLAMLTAAEDARDAAQAAAAAASGTVNRPRCRGVRTTNITGIAANTSTRLTGLTEVYDIGNLLNPSTGIITANTTGQWFLSAAAPVSSFSTAYRRSLVIEKNAGSVGAGTEIARIELESTDRLSLAVSGDFDLVNGDTISAYVNLEAAGTVPAATYPCYLTARLVGA